MPENEPDLYEIAKLPELDPETLLDLSHTALTGGEVSSEIKARQPEVEERIAELIRDVSINGHEDTEIWRISADTFRARWTNLNEDSSPSEVLEALKNYRGLYADGPSGKTGTLLAALTYLGVDTSTIPNWQDLTDHVASAARHVSEATAAFRKFIAQYEHTDGPEFTPPYRYWMHHQLPDPERVAAYNATLESQQGTLWDSPDPAVYAAKLLDLRRAAAETIPGAGLLEGRCNLDGIPPEDMGRIFNEFGNRGYEIARQFYALLSAVKHNGGPVPYKERDDITLGEASPKNFTFEEAVEATESLFASLDPEFSKIFRDALNEGRISILPRPNKPRWSMTTDCTPNLPPYATINTAMDEEGRITLQGLLSVVHESAHVISLEYTRKNGAVDTKVSLPTAEVFSLFCELYFFNQMLSSQERSALTDKDKLETQLAILQRFAKNGPRQVALVRAEMKIDEIAKKTGLSGQQQADAITEQFGKEMEKYLGEEVESTYANTWVDASNYADPYCSMAYPWAMYVVAHLLRRMQDAPETLADTIKDFFNSTGKMPPTELAQKVAGASDGDVFTAFEKRLQEAQTLAHDLGLPRGLGQE